MEHRFDIVIGLDPVTGRGAMFSFSSNRRAVRCARQIRIEDLSDNDRSEIAKFEHYLRVRAAAGPDRPAQALYDAVYGEDTGPRDFRVKH